MAQDDREPRGMPHHVPLDETLARAAARLADGGRAKRPPQTQPPPPARPTAPRAPEPSPIPRAQAPRSAPPPPPARELAAAPPPPLEHDEESARSRQLGMGVAVLLLALLGWAAGQWLQPAPKPTQATKPARTASLAPRATPKPPTVAVPRVTSKPPAVPVPRATPTPPAATPVPRTTPTPPAAAPVPRAIPTAPAAAPLPTPAPKAAPREVSVPSKPTPIGSRTREVVHTVVEGDTLWSIAEHYIHDPLAYGRLANSSGITNPDQIHPGDQVRIIIGPGTAAGE